jgi:UDP-N-acetylglucosamine 4,6-dehydratase
MTRFFVSLNDSVNFVIKSIAMMKGGEIFIPKLFSFKIRDLILTLSSKAKIINIGIRPGEKMHESLISIESYKSIIEFKNHYVVMPSIIFFKKKNYFSNSLNEKGKLISQEFEYSSIKNKNFLNKLSDIKKFLKKNDNSLFKTISK